MLGADAIGLVFYPSSPRYVDLDQAAEIVTLLPPFVTVVGLFVDAEQEYVQRALNRLRIDLLQFHGDEKPDYCCQFPRPWIKAVRMSPDIDLNSTFDRYPLASGFLVDAWQPGTMGGTGEKFDWSRLSPDIAGSLILAGGLTSDNIAEALGTVRPYAVDVSSGVEAVKGIKDTDKMAAFLQEVYQFDYCSRSH